MWHTTVVTIVAIIACTTWAQSKNDWQSKRESCITALSGFPQDASTTSQPLYPSNLEGITLQYFASGCFGSCPAFTLTIGKDFAQFEGHAYVRAKGKRKAKVIQAQFERFLHLWFEGKFFAMRDDYCSIACPDGTRVVVTDIPESSITLTMPTLTKRVYECFTTIDGRPETPKPPDQYFELSRELVAFAKMQHWL
jgi:Domain of unknown function (DUF6438)